MAPIRYQGQIIKWQDDRGFGFIQSPEGGKDIFLHISAVQGARWRPLVGDTVMYELVVEPDGKRRAAKVSIQGATLPSPAKPSKPSAPRQQRPPQTTQPQRPSRPQKTTHRYRLRLTDLLVAAIAAACVAVGIRVIALTTQQGQMASTTGQNQTAALNTNQSPATPVTAQSPSTPTSRQGQPVVTHQSQPTSTNPSQPAPTDRNQPAPTNPSQPAPTNQSQPTPSHQSQANNAPLPPPSQGQPACVIKGNISLETGNRLYHLPGMKDYDITEIDRLKGERWFCTEEEAINNGWRKAPR